MPKHPIYIAMLTDTARAAIGLPHPSGRAAMRMLENEGFGFDNYIDIFDGGPTMTARTDRVKAVRDARTAAVLTCDKDGGDQALVATGRLADFRCAYGIVREQERDRVVLDPGCAQALDVREDDTVCYAGRCCSPRSTSPASSARATI